MQAKEYMDIIERFSELEVKIGISQERQNTYAKAQDKLIETVDEMKDVVNKLSMHTEETDMQLQAVTATNNKIQGMVEKLLFTKTSTTKTKKTIWEYFKPWQWMVFAIIIAWVLVASNVDFTAIVEAWKG